MEPGSAVGPRGRVARSLENRVRERESQKERERESERGRGGERVCREGNYCKDEAHVLKTTLPLLLNEERTCTYRAGHHIYMHIYNYT